MKTLAIQLLCAALLWAGSGLAATRGEPAAEDAAWGAVSSCIFSRPSAVDPDPLIAAASRGDAATLSRLLEERGDRDLEDLLAAALFSGHVSLAEQLWQRGADPSAAVWEASPLLSNPDSELAERGVGALDWLLERGADADARDFAGRTLLMRASAAGNRAAVGLLLGSADVNARDRQGRTALMRASRGGYAEVVELLLAHGADPLVRSDQGLTALAVAHTDQVRRLLR